MVGPCLLSKRSCLHIDTSPQRRHEITCTKGYSYHYAIFAICGARRIRRHCPCKDYLLVPCVPIRGRYQCWVHQLCGRVQGFCIRYRNGPPSSVKDQASHGKSIVVSLCSKESWSHYPQSFLVILLCCTAHLNALRSQPSFNIACVFCVRNAAFKPKN